MTDVCHSAKYVAAAIASGAIVQKVKAVVPSDTLHTEDFQHALATHLVEFGATTKLQTPALTALCETVLKKNSYLADSLAEALAACVDPDSLAAFVSDNGLVVRIRVERCLSSIGLRVWPATHAFLQYLLPRPKWWQQKSILELGSGTGLLGLSLCCAFDAAPASYIFTDLPGSVTDNLEHNVQLNKDNTTSTLIVNPLSWSARGELPAAFQQATPAAPESAIADKIDLIIGSDVVYDPSLIPLLAPTIASLADEHPDAQIVLACMRRTQETREFLDVESAKHGLIVRTLDIISDLASPFLAIEHQLADEPPCEIIQLASAGSA